MFLANFKQSHTLLFATLVGSVVLAPGFYQSAQATQDDRLLGVTPPIALSFVSPDDPAPTSSMGGGVRGKVQFSTPDGTAPQSSLSGGVRGQVQFGVPGETAPKSSLSGGVRGDVRFLASEDVAPHRSESGGVRGEVQFHVPGDAAPQSSESGGVRGNDSPPLTAILPIHQNGHTISSHPTFFVYVPPTLCQQAFFSVQDEQGNFIYHTVLNISGGGMTMAIFLPEDAPELEIGKNYLWMFAPIESDGILRPDNYNVVGWVKRVEPILSHENTALSPIEKATEYAQAGIWYDTLAVLASAQLRHPQDAKLSREWNDLLVQVGLEKLATEPIVFLF